MPLNRRQSNHLPGEQRVIRGTTSHSKTSSKE
jgi:hypothetical protein